MRTLFAFLILFAAVSFSSAAGAAVGLHGEQYNLNFPGADYKNYDSGSYDACRQACEADSTCKAWTAVGPGTPPAPLWYCWLKNSVPASVPDNCCVSGVVNHADNADGGGAAATTPTPTTDNGGQTATAPNGTTIYLKNDGDESADNVAGYVDVGGSVTIVNCSGDWCQVSEPRTGWVWGADLHR